MKKQDLTLIIVIAVISGVISFFVAHSIFTTSQDRNVKAEIVKPITTDFTSPSTKYFNSNSIDPTQPIVIGGQANTAPFNQ